MENKVVLVTGAGRGIGREIAIQFAKAGYDVIINYNGSLNAANETLHEVSNYSSHSQIIKANVSDEQSVRSMFDQIKEAYGHLDVLVNNSGITKDGLMMRMSEDDFMSVIDVNLKGTFLCCKYASQMMMRQRSGSIVNMASVVGISGNAGQVNYAASKAGVIGLTKSLAKEIGSRNIRVNAIAPGFIQTNMTDALSDRVKKQIETSIPLRTLGTVEDVAKMALFLASDDSLYITGQVMHVDGGLLM